MSSFSSSSSSSSSPSPASPLHTPSVASVPWHLLAALAALVLLVAPAGPGFAADDAPDHSEHRWLLELDGRPIGSIVEREEVDADGHRVTTRETRMTMTRMGTTLEVRTHRRFVETADGEPLRAETVADAGGEPVETLHLYGPDGVEVIRTQGDRTTRSTAEPPAADALPPVAAQRELARRVAGGEDAFTLRMLDPSAGTEPTVAHYRRLEDDAAPELAARVGTPLPDGASLWQVDFPDLGGIRALDLLDGEAVSLANRFPLLGMELVAVRTGREEIRAALAPGDPAGGEGATPPPPAAPDLLSASLVVPEPPLERPRELVRAVYELHLPDGTLPELPTAGAQRLVRHDGATVRLEVDVERPVDGGSPGGDENGDGEGHGTEAIDTDLFLAATTWLDTRDPAVVALAERALAKMPEDAPVARRAEVLRAFVEGFVSEKNLESGFATASEVARSASGDCTEHGVLLAALLRVDGIPSRVVSGMVFLPVFAGHRNVFGYHLWTQAWIDGRWVDLDSTLPGPFDAAHIALGTAALEDAEPTGASFQHLLPLLGRLEVRVLETRHRDDGARSQEPASTPTPRR